MRASDPARAFRRLESWLWTGPAGHLIGGALDLLGALARHSLTRPRRALARRLFRSQLTR